MAGERYFDLLDRLEQAAEAPRLVDYRYPLAPLCVSRSGSGCAGPSPRSTKSRRTRSCTPCGSRSSGRGTPPSWPSRPLGKESQRFVAAAKALPDVLGEHQDAVVAEERIRSWLSTTRSTAAHFRRRAPGRASARAAPGDRGRVARALARARACREEGEAPDQAPSHLGLSPCAILSGRRCRLACNRASGADGLYRCVEPERGRLQNQPTRGSGAPCGNDPRRVDGVDRGPRLSVALLELAAGVVRGESRWTSRSRTGCQSSACSPASC